MTPRAWLPALLVLSAACGGVEDRDRWRYERILYEEDPGVRSRDDARGRFDRLADRPELTLRECHEMALHRSESLALSGEELVRVQTQYEQLVGAVLPYVAFRGSLTRQERARAGGGGSVERTFIDHQRTQYQVTAHQPIFSGLREFYAIREKNLLYEAKEHELRHARLLVFADVADAFYAILQIDRDLATTSDSLRLAQERLEELVQRNRAGISRRSEVLAQEAEVASIQAGLERLKGALAVAWEALQFLTGLPSPRKLSDLLPEPGELPPVQTYLLRAQADRQDLRALERRISAADQAVGVARADYLPALDLDANYYTHREGFNKPIDWDVVLALEIPVFEGGVAQARMREARSNVRSARFELERLRREIALQINRAYADVKALQSELGSLEKAVASAQENYEIVQAEYRRNIVTNIEVLASFNTLQQARLRRDRARYQAKLAAIRLEVQSGTLPGSVR
jgi:outer membrane protein